MSENKNESENENENENFYLKNHRNLLNLKTEIE
jgi:hypothetical protein